MDVTKSVIYHLVRRMGPGVERDNNKKAAEAALSSAFSRCGKSR
jgi:hypothetical protein